MPEQLLGPRGGQRAYRSAGGPPTGGPGGNVRLIILLTFLLSCAGSALLGLRLLLAGLRTRTVPELAYGASLLLVGIGSIVRLIVFGILGAGPDYHAWVIGASVLQLLTLMTLTWGLRVIFRSQAGWAWGLMLALWLPGAAALGVVVAHPGGAPEAGPIYFLGDLVNNMAVAWGACESFSYYAKMRRRLALGLADPMTTARFKLWGTSFSFGWLAGATLVAVGVARSAPITEVPIALVIVQTCLLAMTVITWWAFYPPAFLRRWVDARAEASQAAHG